MMVSMNGSAPMPPPINSTVPTLGTEAGARAKHTEGSFDQVKISHSPEGESKFHKELVSRLVQEVRTNHTTGEVQRIREEIRSGTYQMDLAAIATRMMLEG